MSKRILAVALALGILATSNAFASRSRTSVLGTGDGGLFLNGGTFFYDDARNIFYNPAYVNDFKNWGIIEKSNFAATGFGSSAEGGFVSSLSSFNLGVYLNRVSSLINTTGTNMASLNNQRPIEVFFGGDMNNVKWGLGLNYGMFHSAANNGTSDTNLILHAGAEVADFEPFGWATLVGSEKTAAGGTSDTSYKSYGVGLRYKMGEWLPFAAWRQDKVVDTKDTRFIFGLGRTTKIGEGARMNYSIGFVRATLTERSAIPIDVSVEADANSWLTARAGLSHNIYDRTGSASTADNTTGRVGMGIHVGKGDIDFTVGKQALTNATTETSGIADAQINDISNGFFSQLSVGYHW